MKLSPAATTRVEESALCSRCFHMDSFIAQGAQLPTSYPASHGQDSSGSSRQAQSGGTYTPLGAWLETLRASGGNAGSEYGTSSAQSPSPASGPPGTSAFQGKPYTLAGAQASAQASAVASPAPPSPSKLAAAAEARQARAGGRSAGSGSAGSRHLSEGGRPEGDAEAQLEAGLGPHGAGKHQ